ncbi:hypothetical protein ACFV2H_13405 [Streptomyces sp. NPDC059629]|uniref:hypothetical protein n=1 Tax=Streptomyces sp. NPDC059629 TaxID=3346889 RepID=UPI0036A2F7E2
MSVRATAAPRAAAGSTLDAASSRRRNDEDDQGGRRCEHGDRLDRADQGVAQVRRQRGGRGEQALLCPAGEVAGGDRQQHRRREGGQRHQQPQQVGRAAHVLRPGGVDDGCRRVAVGRGHDAKGQQHAVPVGHVPSPARPRGRPKGALPGGAGPARPDVRPWFHAAAVRASVG